MVATTEEFVTRFHSLEGVTIGEKQKNLFVLLNGLQDPQNIDFNSIQPKSPLEDNFKVQIFIHYKNVPELIKVLKSENPAHIKRVLKVSSWILEEILDYIDDEEQFIENIFPYLSFNAKVKIINKMAKYLNNREKADKMFSAINKRYGSYLATKLLPCCSKEVILSCLRTLKIEITPRQLLIIIQRNLLATEDILETLAESSTRENIAGKYKTVFKYIARNDLFLFLKVLEVYGGVLCFRLGWRSTGNLALQNKELIIKNSRQLYHIMHSKQLTKSLSKDFDEFYFHLLPSLKNLKERYNYYLDIIPKSLPRANVFTRSFEKKYSVSVWQQQEFITPGFLELMPIDERETWMDSNSRPNHINEESWICLLKTEKSLPALKVKISLTSDIEERTGLICCLVDTCRINNDKSAVTSVLKYVLAQHRNDSNSVLYSFLTALKRCFKVEDFLEEYWKYILEIVRILIARNQLPYYYMDWYSTYLYFSFLKGLPIKSEFREIAEKCNFNGRSYNDMKKKHIKRKFLILYGELIPELYKDDTIEKEYVEFLSTIIIWNKKHPNDKISLLPYKTSFNFLLKFLSKEERVYCIDISEVVLHCWLSPEIEKGEKDQLLDIFFQSKQYTFDMKLFEWLIQYQPLLLMKYLDPILYFVLDFWYTMLTPYFWICCKNYFHLGIPQKIIETCLSILNNKEENDSRKRNSVTALSYLMEPDTFINLIKPYYPSDSVIDVNNKENQEMYKMQQAITASLKNVVPPSKVIESVLLFTKGDYLKYIQRSLYSVSHNVPEIKLINFFTLLSDRPVSVRKHAIYLGFKVLNKNEIFKILELVKHEKNSSIVKFLFKASFNYFCKNPAENVLWETVVKHYIKKVDINDKEALEMLMDFNKIPKMFLIDYIMFSWEFLDGHPKSEEETLREAKILLLNCVEVKKLSDFPQAFCINIFMKYFLKFDQLTTFHKSIISFAVKILLCSSSEIDRAEYIKVITNEMNQYVQSSNWKKLESKKVVFFFVEKLCNTFNDNSNLHVDLIQEFMGYWNQLLTPYEAFSEYLCLNFTLIFSSLNVAEISIKLTEFCNNLFGVCGIAITDLFCSSLQSHVTRFLNTTVKDGDEELKEQHLLILIESVLAVNNSINCLLMVMSLLPKSISKTKLNQRYKDIMAIIKNSTDISVQLYLSVYVKTLEIKNAYEDDICMLEKKKPSRRYVTYIEAYDSKYKK